MNLPDSRSRIHQPTPAEVARLLEENCNDPHGVVTDELIAQFARLLGEVRTLRGRQKLEPWDEGTQAWFLANAVTVAGASKDLKPRRSGDPVFAGHLLPVAAEGVNACGDSDIVTVNARLAHDLAEDTHVQSYAAYRHALRETVSDPDLWRRAGALVGPAWGQVLAVTKTKDEEGNRARTSDLTTRHLIEMIGRLGLRPLLVKVPDRLHNMRTLIHQRPHQQTDISLETLRVHAPFAEMAGLHGPACDLAETGLLYTNASLVHAFAKRMGLWLAERLDSPLRPVEGEAPQTLRSYLDQIFQPVRGGGSSGGPSSSPSLHDTLLRSQIKGWEIEPMRLGALVVHRPDIDSPRLSLSDLSMDSEDSVFEVKVIMKSERGVGDMINYIIQNCALPGERRYTEPADTTGISRGQRLTIYSSRYGTITFRINDETSEARSLYGRTRTEDEYGLAPEGKGARNPKPPKSLSDEQRQAVERILRETQGANLSRVRAVAAEHLAHPTSTFWTPRNHPVTLPHGATALDFAGTVHTGLLAEIAGVAIKMADDPDYRPWSLFRRLPEAATVRILKPGVARDEELMQRLNIKPMLQDPGWLHFFRSDQMREAFRQSVLLAGSPKKHGKGRNSQSELSPEETAARTAWEAGVRKQGADYLDRILDLFGLDSNETRLTLLKSISTRTQDQGDAPEQGVTMDLLHFKIGAGKFNLLGKLQEKYFSDTPEWHLRLNLPNQPRQIAPYLSQLSETDGLQVDHPLFIRGFRSAPYTVRHRISGRPPEETMRLLLRLSYEYPSLQTLPSLRILNQIPWGRAAQNVRDGATHLLGLLLRPFLRSASLPDLTDPQNSR
ncbi:hypothetical protein CO046_02025 [Candidatus Peregrinibacteria bacterium CG_4_9_14_0_2_um_filter_53_11]|nr:MAG: hypothetical protein CO046_02025 [Candidatus Peregrinibacteria bacterium CG_4_9_14_0_2_um_filter_53_11]